MSTKRVLTIVMTFIILTSCTGCGLDMETIFNYESGSAVHEMDIKPYDDVRERDLTAYSFKNTGNLLYTLSFDTHTKWPKKSRLPKGFDPEKLLAQGKDPGLGIRKLQESGLTGKGVTIAYIDQHLLLNHEAYSNVDLIYCELQKNDPPVPSMHGPSVLSLLAGREIGIVPDAKVYFFAHNGAMDGNEYEAQGFEKIIEMNKTLTDDKKIRIVGMSHAADDRLGKENADHLRKAQQAARDSGIIVVDETCGMLTCGVQENKPRDDYLNYSLSSWESNFGSDRLKGSLIVPADCRTTAIGHNYDSRQYAYWGEADPSWGVPYIVGVITMGLQINPNLTEAEAFKYLHQSAHSYLGGDMINPEGFIELVKKNCPMQ